MEAIEAAGRAYLASLSPPITAKCAQFSIALKRNSLLHWKCVQFSTALKGCAILCIECAQFSIAESVRNSLLH